jgi:hypothetical protein
MSSSLDERMETNALFLLLNEKAAKPVDPKKPVMIIGPETQSGSHDHSRVMEAIIFNTDDFDPEVLEEALTKWGQRDIGQSEVTHLQAVSRFPDGTSKNITFASLGKFGVQDNARHETVANKPAAEFIQEIENVSKRITPDMKTVTDFAPNYGQPMGKMKFQTSVVQL